jgi:membrane-associated phospholipid phosphatase
MTKVVVSCAVGAGLLYSHSPVALLYGIGALANAVATKVAKRIIKAPRPESAPDRKKGSAGMPSSHASSLAFLSVAFALLQKELYTLGVVAGAVFAASWRVHANYHTVPQMVAGIAFGSVAAWLWVENAMPHALPQLQSIMNTYGHVPVTAAAVAIVRVTTHAFASASFIAQISC